MVTYSRLTPGNSQVRGILISLISVVLLAVAGIGWLVSQVYGEIANNPTQIDTLYVSLGSQLAKALDTSNPSTILANWPTDGLIELSLADEDELPLPDNLRTKLLRGEPILLEDNKHLLINYFLPNHNAILTLAMASPPSRGGKINVILTVVFYCGLIGVLLLWLYPLLRRLVKLQEAARAFGAGELDARIKPSRWSYISTLETAFNQMAGRVQTLLADNRLLSRAVSHDLKTPLARLRFGFEMLEEMLNLQEPSKYFQRIGQDLSAMENLITRLLDYAKLEEGQIKFNFQPVNLNDVVRHLCKQLPETHRQIDIKLDAKECWINADSHYLAMLINNLLNNAFYYSRRYIEVRTHRGSNSLTLSISDDGPGIPMDERCQVLKPFVRGQAANPNGHGMGLAIAERIASWHKAEIKLDEAIPLGGVIAEITFATTNSPKGHGFYL